MTPPRQDTRAVNSRIGSIPEKDNDKRIADPEELSAEGGWQEAAREARQGDPSARGRDDRQDDGDDRAGRRAELLAQVRDRSRLRWVPASDLLRQWGTTGASEVLRVEERIRIAAKEPRRASQRSGRQGAQRRGLGIARPLTANQGREATARSAPTR